MTAKAAMVAVAALALTALTALGTGLGSRAARAENACLTAPNAPAPAGEHWFYRTNQATQQKCWYLKPQAQAARPQATQTQATQAQATEVQAAQGKPDRAANDMLARRVQAAITAPGANAHAGTPANASTATWSDPAPSAGATSFAWPDPPPPPTANDATANEPPATTAAAESQAATAPSSPAAPAVKQSPGTAPPAVSTGAATPQLNPAAAAAKPALPAAPAAASQASANAHPASPAAAANAGQVKGARHGIAAAMKLAGIILLLIAGMLMRRMLTKAFGRRQKIHIERREPVLVDSVTAPLPVPAQLAYSPALVPGPGHDDTDERIAEIEAVLGKLAQRLRPPRATAAKTAPSFFPSHSARNGARSRNIEIRPI